jgi:glycerol-3-phosphate dehydrogenase
MKHEPGRAYESEIDALIRKMREEPKIEAERQRNWSHWWNANPLRRDTVNAGNASDEVQTQEFERDMAYASRRSQRQGGRA